MKDIVLAGGSGTRLYPIYNIGGFNEWKNIDLIKVIIKTVDKLLNRPEGASEKLVTYVTCRAGHDLRYAIDATKLKTELGWEPCLQFEEGIEKTEYSGIWIIMHGWRIFFWTLLRILIPRCR